MANEKRLIDAFPLMQNGWHLIKTGKSNEFLASMSLADVPQVDAVEVVHGRWKNKQTNSIFTWHLECSVCGADYNTSVGYNYCPNCGAKMDGDS